MVNPPRPSTSFKYKPINVRTPPTAPAPPSAGKGGRTGPRLAPIIMGGAVLYVTATYVSMLVFRSKEDTTKYVTEEQQQQKQQQQEPLGAPRTMGLRADQAPKLSPACYDTSGIWGQVASSYDKEIGMDETVMGIGLLRWWLVSQAKGDVLEVSAGTGRNFGYYNPDKVTSLLVTDDHAAMVDAAKTKFDQFKEKFHNTFVKFQRANVDTHLAPSPTSPLPPMQQNEQKEQKETQNCQHNNNDAALEGKFDTVIDTFGLCSCRDPAEALISMADACKSEESRILLLEHGRSHYSWLNRLLDANVDKHVQKWGCWWNRPIMELFDDDRVKEKVEIVSSSRWHFGTTCYIVARPRRGNDNKVKPIEHPHP
ncbi:hypothetical protein BC940DRAFT_288101 [Gongronella butleri]|nr:hypothetical protein BC940DRAFT_288101 [Gongronella butleri]